MMAGRLREEARAMLDRAAFGIGRAEIEAADAGKGDGGGAHGARLERHIEVAIGEPLAAELGAGGADGEQLGMRGRVAQGERAVAGGCQHLAIGAHHHGADRHFAEVARAFGLVEGQRPWAARPCHAPPHLQASASWAAKWGSSAGRVKPRGQVGAQRARGQGRRAHAHRQGDRPCRAMLAARCRGLDRGRPRRRQRQGADHAGPCGVGPGDTITVDGKPLPEKQGARLWRYHKRRGLVTSHKDPQGRKTVFEVLPPELPRVVSVGRLDINTEGLLLLTTDGELARHLELPSTGWLRRYRVRAHGRVTQEALDRLRQGVTLDGIHYGPVEARIDREQGSNLWLTISLREGKNREVKRIAEHLGLTVNRLIRVSFGPFALGDLPEGAVEEVKRRVLADQLGAKLVGAIRTGRAGEAAPPGAPQMTRCAS